MSDSLSIAAVTATLRQLISDGVEDELGNEVEVTTKPLDKARNGSGSTKQLNLYLYHTLPNGGLRNMDMPGRTRPGETGHPPLALDLFYLVTAYGENDDDVQGEGHRLLGEAMSALHDHPVLGRDEIKNAMEESNLHEQVERIRITPLSMSLDEMSKLWNSFQTQHRVSAAYQVSVVLIESARALRTPLPVLSRGRDDRGAFAVAEASPTLAEIRLPKGKSGAELGDQLIIRGENLRADGVIVRFEHTSLDNSMELPPTEIQLVVDGKPETALRVQLPAPADDPAAPANWPIGFYRVFIVVKKNQVPSWSSNALSFALVPTAFLSIPAPPPLPPEIVAGAFDVELSCVPRIVTGQRVELLFGDRLVESQAVETDPGDTAQPSRLEFKVSAEPRDNPYTLRVRVAGVDSIPVDFSQSPPRFNPALQIKVISP